MADHFRDPLVAKTLNESYVCILLDREERPDVDEVYQTFVQAVSPDGRSGWPMTVFLTPDLTPFVGVTYLDLDKLKGALQSIAGRWKDTRASIVVDAQRVITALGDLSRAKRERAGETLGQAALTAAYEAASASFDAQFGGFGAPPKFPRPSLFEFLAGTSLMHGAADSSVGREAADMLDFSLLKMSRGAIHDQLGGAGGSGFFRYSTTADWQTPRFEKLLSDQAQLALSYLQAYLIGGGDDERNRNPSFRSVVMSTLDFCLETMRVEETGAFASAMDSDSPSPFDLESGGKDREGVFYLWSEWELKLILGEQGSSIFGMRYGIRPEGNLYGNGEFAGLNILRVAASIEMISDATGKPEGEVVQILGGALARLRGERDRRPKPKVDDMAIVCWNGLLISVLARAGRALGERRYLDAACAAMKHILVAMVCRVDEALDALFLYRTHRSGFGPGRVEAFAQDYCAAIQACIDLFEAAPIDSAPEYLAAALKLQRALDSAFWHESGGYATTTEGDSSILLRRVEDYDGAEPSPSSLGALNCVRLASITGNEFYWRRARDIADSFAPVLAKSPLAMPMLLVSVQAFAATGSRRVVILGSDEEAAGLLRDFWSRGLPRSVALLRLPKGGAGAALSSLLSAGRMRIRAVDNKATAYVCTGESCQAPTVDPAEFSRQLDCLVKVAPGARP
jgi:uncharacterized protein